MLRTCLLVTDDMDDHQVISEALGIVSERTILLNIIDSQKAVLLLKESTYRPDYIMLDLSMHGIKVNSIISLLRDVSGQLRIPTIIFGLKEKFLQIEDNEGLIFIDKDCTYSDLREFLGKVFA
jgi:hypothetical protein